MIEIRTGNAEIGRSIWRLQITWEQRREVFINDAIRVIVREGETSIEVDSTLLFASLPATALGVSEEELWATPYAQLQELALKVGLWLWTGVEPDRVEVEDLPLARADGTENGRRQDACATGVRPLQENRLGSGPAEHPTSSIGPQEASDGTTTINPMR